jgi:hypothetical protein
MLATTDMRRSPSGCPCGHEASADDSAIGRRNSKSSPHVRHRYS